MRACVRACLRGTIRRVIKRSDNEEVQDTAVVPALLYGCENLCEMKQDDTRLATTDMNCLRLCVEKKNQLDVTVCFIALMKRSTCFGHFYAYHQEL